MFSQPSSTRHCSLIWRERSGALDVLQAFKRKRMPKNLSFFTSIIYWHGFFPVRDHFSAAAVRVVTKKNTLITAVKETADLVN